MATLILFLLCLSALLLFLLPDEQAAAGDEQR